MGGGSEKKRQGGVVRVEGGVGKWGMCGMILHMMIILGIAVFLIFAIGLAFVIS